MSTWLPKAHAIDEADLKTLEKLDFEWIEVVEVQNKNKDECTLLGFYVHPVSRKPFAAIAIKDPDFIVGKKCLYYCEALSA